MPSSSSNYNNNKGGVSMKKEKGVSKAKVLLSEENRGFETGETSFRVYYGEKSATVPFMWESQPGTPKHPIFNHHDILPPLTPPPSYNPSASINPSPSRKSNRKPRINFSAFLSSVIGKRRSNSSNLTPTSVLSSSSYSGPLSWSRSSSSSSSGSSPRRKKHNRSHTRSLSLCSSSRANKFPLFDDDEHQDVDEDVGRSPSRTTTTTTTTSSAMMCFGFKNQGCYSMQDMKNALLSIKGH